LAHRARILVLSLLAPLVFTGCAMVVSPVGNAIYTQVKGPIDAEAAKGGSKQGRACNYVGVVAIGDASIEAAKKHGGITNVSTVDHESFSVMGVYSHFCTLVVGE